MGRVTTCIKLLNIEGPIFPFQKLSISPQGNMSETMHPLIRLIALIEQTSEHS